MLVLVAAGGFCAGVVVCAVGWVLSDCIRLVARARARIAWWRLRKLPLPKFGLECERLDIANNRLHREIAVERLRCEWREKTRPIYHA